MVVDGEEVVTGDGEPVLTELPLRHQAPFPAELINQAQQFEQAALAAFA